MPRNPEDPIERKNRNAYKYDNGRTQIWRDKAGEKGERTQYEKYTNQWVVMPA